MKKHFVCIIFAKILLFYIHCLFFCLLEVYCLSFFLVAEGRSYTHFLRLKSIQYPGLNCVICFAKKANITFNYNRKIFTICRSCCFEFLRLSFMNLHGYNFHTYNNDRTNIVYIFFKDFIFSKDIQENISTEEKFNFFHHPFTETINKLPVEKRLTFLNDLASKRMR